MLLYLSWRIEGKNGSHLGNNTILHHVHTTFVNLVDLIKDHKLHIDSESYGVCATTQGSILVATNIRAIASANN